MYFRGTRDPPGSTKRCTFDEVLLSNLASRGGIYLPEQVPTLSHSKLKALSTLPYGELCHQLLSEFIEEDYMNRSDFSSRIFEEFDDPKEVIHVTKLQGGLNIAELYLGPTLAFKDLALSVLGNLVDSILEKKKKKAIVLVATSGDTGSAAIHSVKKMANADIIVLYPKGRCTHVQELQMTTVQSPNVHVFAVEGTSDDLDEVMLAVISDSAFAEEHGLLIFNSINVGRILGQIPMYFCAYYHLCNIETMEPLEVVVPTGGCGSIAAGTIAAKMGLPIKIVACTNKNDVVTRCIQNADFSKQPYVYHTYASAMDIQCPYNMERIFHLFCEGDGDLVQDVMGAFESQGKIVIPPHVHASMNDVIHNYPFTFFQIVESYSVSDEEILKTMRRCWDENSYAICPHTSTAVSFHFAHRKAGFSKFQASIFVHCSPTIRRVVLATASLVKFPEVSQACGIPVPSHPRVDALPRVSPQVPIMKEGDDWGALLRQKIMEIKKLRWN
ncbi:unnamed protein product [Darwinula stevensoni]|uniref:Threonine synthase-like 2 n=1 Tax=Darwinula stevensoni TaxID=69355 RepID=A0A7R8X0E1_9CRUS|nr:unnamed protein product [Darwinula stevensoni]CAG0879067.1 unnamed protein product [Darwinula stevensoni]